MDRVIVICFFLSTLSACTEQKLQKEPYNGFIQVGLLGHGRGLLGDLRINYYGVQRRCDSCHTNSPAAHENLGTCNSCHQPHNGGWKHTMVAIFHNDVLILENRKYHFKLACKECHDNMTSRQNYRKVQCIHCHNHSKADIIYAHELMDDFSLERDNKDSRCIDCHSMRGKEFTRFYNPKTNKLL